MHDSRSVTQQREGEPQGDIAAGGIRAAAAGGGGLGLAILLAFFSEEGLRHFFYSYLVSYAFYLSISLGALSFVALQHASRAGWSVTVRRLNEILAANMPLLGILFLPLAVSLFLPASGPYVWADPEHAAHSPLVQHKESYLNVPFFLVRAVFYLGLWTWMARFFFTRSVQQDVSGDPELTVRMERSSGPIILLFALTITFASFDWLMSVEPEWFSSIYGVYYYSGATVGGLAAVILLAIVAQKAGYAAKAITTEHYHDMGKLLFGFVVFWGYIAFSQYMLIWYANIPEETIWYMARQKPAWLGFSVVLLAGHLFIPFLGLISREVKRRKLLLGFWCVWLLLFHWLDMYYLVMPSFTTDRFPLGLIDVCLLVGLGGLYVAGVLRTARGVALVPAKDPRLGEALAFENL
jgi:hypothetical protein